MKIAIVQMNSITGDLFGNTKKIKDGIRRAKENGAHLVVFPEMALTGYCISDLIEDESFIEKNKSLIYEISKESEGIVAIIGFIDYDHTKKNDDGRVRKYNSAAVIQNGIVLGVVNKSLLPNYRYFDEKRYFNPSEKRDPVEIIVEGKKVKLGVSICEDLWDESYLVKPIKELAEKGAEIIININASPFYHGKSIERDKIIKKQIENIGLPFVYVNTVGSADNGKNIIPFDGESSVFNKNGELTLLGKKFDEEILFVDLENKNETKIKREKYSSEKEIFEALVMSLKDYANQIGFKKAILPLSGGIDSALGLVICVEALGSGNVIAYNLPSEFNTDTTKNIAKKLSRNLNVEYRTIPVQEIDEKIREVYEKNVSKIKRGVTKENLHARIRGLLMMLESNDNGSLLVSNGNKTEIALGYSTLYGDMCGGISVIGDLSKSQVYKISKYVNERFEKEIIPEEIFKIKPSAELSLGQYDPFDYPIVSPLVDLFVEERNSINDIIEKFKDKNLGESFPREVYSNYSLDEFKSLVYSIYGLIKKSVYKRLQGPPIISVTKRSFGFDLRETLVNYWEGR
ncbi:MAG: NAD+ synthase [Nanoarchaeota archaeon]|nr:NAD+ synthase [Nanoarchaeota archaeon]